MYLFKFHPLWTLVAATLSLLFGSCNPRSESTAVQPALGYRSAQLLEINGLQFKDLSRDGELTPYEDWRLSHEQRANDLVGRMSLEQKVGFMLISSTRMENDWAFDRGRQSGPLGSGFNEEDQVMAINIFTRKPLDYPMMGAAGTTKAVTQFHERHFILRANPSARLLAEWANNLQALCEGDGLGIPAIIASNPRNHITSNAAAGLSVGQTAFTQWPGELGLAAMRDLNLARQFADVSRQEWLAGGLRKGYMYMADLATEPRWQRIEGTFGEDAQLAAEMTREIVLGFQGESLSETSVALTTKHFPGGGATEGGQDPHFEWGKREVFPGGQFENNLIPFKAAIEAGTSAIMPYYSFPVGTEYEEVAYAYNKKVLQDLLRGTMGFDGIINSDTGPIMMMPWGVEGLGITERYKLALEAGINLFSGTADPSQLLATLEQYPELIPLVDESVERLLLEKFRLGLFENPYVDVEAAEATIGKKEFRDLAEQSLRKSIVLLRNGAENTPTLPLTSGTKVYFESYQQRRGAEPNNVIIPTDNPWGFEFVGSAAEADVVILWLFPQGKSLFASDGSPLYVSLSKNGIDVSYVNQLMSEKPTILAINFTSPWVIDEIYSEGKEHVAGVLATFGTSSDALLDVISGAFAPTGKMPFTTPISEEKAQNQLSDVPGYDEGPDYSLFRFDEGLTY